MKKYFITGGAGFIGREIVNQLLPTNAKITIFDDFSFGREANILEFSKHPNFSVINGKVEIYQEIHDAIKTANPDYIIHLAALHFIPYCNKYPLETIKVNTDGTYAVFHAASTLGVKRVVSASSGAIYPSTEDPLEEMTQVARPVDVYGCSKWLTENIGDFITWNNKNLELVTVRLFNTYGPYETNEHIIPEMIKQLKIAHKLDLGNIKTKRDYIYVKDTASGFINLAHAELTKNHEIVNLGTGVEYSAEEIIQFISTLINKNIEVNINPEKFRPVDKLHQIASTEKLFQLTGWKPTISLNDGLEMLLKHEGLL